MPRCHSTGPKAYKCFNCPNRTRPRDRYPIPKKVKALLLKRTGRTPSKTDSLCNRCRHQYQSLQRENVPSSSITTSSSSVPAAFSPPSVTLPFPSTLRGHSYCCICKRPGPKLVVVPVDVRHRIFVTHEIIIPAGSRCCPNHLQQKIEDMNPISSSTCLNRQSIVQLLKFLRCEVLRSERTRLNFESPSQLTDRDYKDLLGLSRESFEDMLQYIEGRVRSTPARTTRTSLAIFLMKLRGGESNRVLSTLFNVSKSSIRRGIKAVRSALIDGTFVTENVGFQHITRDQVIEHHTRPLAQTLFGDSSGRQAILVLDGTYIYIKKSGNFRFQRQSFSFHKGRPLVKPMVIVSTTGYFISVLGPYFATNNDASILNHIMKSNVEDIRTWVAEDDIFVVDRGFRDSLVYLEELGIKAEIPSFMEKGEKQMTTDAANMSRLVTKVIFKSLIDIHVGKMNFLFPFY